MGTRRKKAANKSKWQQVGRIGELMFAAEATSRGCIVCTPVGGDPDDFDCVLLTPSGKLLTVQIKAQSTVNRKAVGMTTTTGNLRGHADIFAICTLRDGWHLMSRKHLTPRQRTIPVSQWRKYLDNWKILK